MTELTEYLIELGRMLGVDTDTEGCVNPNLARSARIVLAIGELERRAAQSSEITAERDRVREWVNSIHLAKFQMSPEKRSELYWYQMNGKRIYIVDEAESAVEFEADTAYKALTAYLKGKGDGDKGE